MSPMLELTTAQTNVLNKASKRAVSDIFQKSNDLKNGHWLHPSNSYLVDTTNKIHQDIQSDSINQADLGSYISISAPLHCFDGWTYLSRSVSSLLEGDFNTARHLGYYAELRAAISILATEGIGILGGDHFVIDNKEMCVRVPGTNRSTATIGTHKIAWPVFEHWAKQASAASLIGSTVKPYSVNLQDWHSVFASGITFPAIAEKWLISWGLDLAQLNIDHETRNEVSYRPLGFVPTSPIIPIDISAFVQEFWKLFMPSGASRFDEIDRYLLNKSLQDAHKALRGGRKYEERVDLAVSALFSDKEEAVLQSYNQFLSLPQETLVLTEANSSDASTHPRHVYQLLSRASLLLRLATGASSDLILSAGISSSDFDFWWKKLGLDAGFWDTDNEPVSPDELWIDIESSLSEVDSWMTAARDPSVYKMHTDNNNAMHYWILSGTERIAMWGLHR